MICARIGSLFALVVFEGSWIFSASSCCVLWSLFYESEKRVCENFTVWMLMEMKIFMGVELLMSKNSEFSLSRVNITFHGVF